MRIEKLPIKVNGAKKAELTIYLQTDFAQFHKDKKKPMILICPGGGYTHVSPREGESIALQFLANNCHAAVLVYDVDEEITFPTDLMELAESVAYIREHAEEFLVDADKIIVGGFSAGGHLAASLGCFWDKDWLLKEMTGRTKEDYKPNGMILAYPVITSGEFAHRGSFDNLLKAKYKEGDPVTGLKGEELLNYTSLENQVTKMVPPVFMWHTFEDGAVPLENSLYFAKALRENNVNFEYHVFPHGGHGYALGTLETANPDGKELDAQIPQWIGLAKKWMETNF